MKQELLQVRSTACIKLEVRWVVTASVLCVSTEKHLLPSPGSNPGSPPAHGLQNASKGAEVPSKYRWHPTVHFLEDLQAAMSELPAPGSTQNLTVQSSSHWGDTKTTSRQQMGLLQLCHWVPGTPRFSNSLHLLCAAGISSQRSAWDPIPGSPSHRRWPQRIRLREGVLHTSQKFPLPASPFRDELMD